MMGIIESRQPPIGYEDVYQVSNIWVGEERTVAAGFLRADPGQGILVVMESFVWPQVFLGEYRPPVKTGALRITNANGTQLTVSSEGGTQFVFDTTVLEFLPGPP
jgi:hypothetical protein